MSARYLLVSLSAALIAVVLGLGAREALMAPDSDLPWWVFGAGGGSSSSTNYDAGATAGQTAVGAAQSANYALGAGFWHGAALDSDGDAVFDLLDNCPFWPNGDQALPPWVVPANDPDCDGFTDAEEAFVGTGALDPCAETPSANDEADDRWPPDFDDNQWVNILDAVVLTPPVFNSMTGDQEYIPRGDFDGNGWINILDFVRLTPPVFNHICS